MPNALGLTQEAAETQTTAGILTCCQAVNVFPNAGSVTSVYAAKGNSQQPDCTGFSPVSLLNAMRGVPVADAKVRKIYGDKGQTGGIRQGELTAQAYLNRFVRLN